MHSLSISYTSDNRMLEKTPYFHAKKPCFFALFCTFAHRKIPVPSIQDIMNNMKVGLFIPCYVDALYPEVGVAAYKLLKHLQVDVTYPMNQTCCGQPMANAGFEQKAVPLAKRFDDIKSLPGKFPHKVSLHNSCHGVRELGLSSPSERNVPKFNKIKDLLSLVEGVTVVEPERVDECCGFGGMFSIEEPAVSTQMGIDKLQRHIATGAEYITGPDSSCLMHLEGVARRQRKDIKFIHVVQILAAGL